MGRQPDFVSKKFRSLQDKTLTNALAHCIGKEFPRIGGRRMLNLCAEMIVDVVRRHLRARDYLSHGQVLWIGISVDDPPSYGKTTAETDLVPVILDLSTLDDVQSRIERTSSRQRLLQKAMRLCQQAYRQGALLSNSDLAELLNQDPSLIGRLLAKQERATGEVIPRRATLHDIGSGMTHKHIICWKRYAQGKSTEEIARETYHSLDAVDRYLGQYDRVRHCQLQGMSVAEIAFTLGCSVSLVNEYLEIDRQLERNHE